MISDDDYHKPIAISHDVALCDGLNRGPKSGLFTQIWLPDRMAGVFIGVTWRKLHDVLGIAA